MIKKLGLDLTYSNYRPVSNLNFLSKVLEKAALLQFFEHTNHLLPEYQSAYRANHSCETALVKLMDDLLWAMECQKVTALMAVDLSAAFDTVDHDILLAVLNKNYGVTDNALKWMDSYLRPRSCKININSAYSEAKDLPFSVPQGSCAGPVLFLASTLSNIITPPTKIYGYADDHALTTTFSTNRQEELTAISSLEQCAIHVKSWMDGNRLKMNSSKTEFILFSSRRQLDKCATSELNVNGDQVQRASHVKYLGAYLDDCLTLRQHISHASRIAMWNLQRIKLIRKSLTKQACETLILG